MQSKDDTCLLKQWSGMDHYMLNDYQTSQEGSHDNHVIILLMVYRTTWKVVQLSDITHSPVYYSSTELITHLLSYDFVSHTIFRLLLMPYCTIQKLYYPFNYSYWLPLVDSTK
jgi:hypothetical protein